ncbi:Fur-regulated basic protein FbpA [Aquibacillus halophilus]|uniref:Fur-regulated basic protein FbpA n=1 Tax=Aquibacillus halophilus TaxID=930132 RepID=A0A6A8DF59_9BACI|nr:Fur-regulated basic protein FbpA [Aquibacillus halophilus]MRH44293.1 Fur-regulated basic protein FbpA [Aquibacillus halophilus]
MAYLREAVQNQKEFLIAQLVNQGIAQPEDNELHNKTISEIINEYDQFTITTSKSSKNSLRFIRSIHFQENRKPYN